MKTGLSMRSAIATLMLALSAISTTPAFAADSPKKDSGAADSAVAVAAYPLTTCVVSGDVLENGSMGPPVNYVYKQAGKPDRLVRFCCDSCIDDFNENPQKYLKMIDDAAAAKAKDKKPSQPSPHQHKK